MLWRASSCFHVAHSLTDHISELKLLKEIVRDCFVSLPFGSLLHRDTCCEWLWDTGFSVDMRLRAIWLLLLPRTDTDPFGVADRERWCLHREQGVAITISEQTKGRLSSFTTFNPLCYRRPPWGCSGFMEALSVMIKKKKTRFVPYSIIIIVFLGVFLFL